MKILIVDTYYPAFLHSFYRQNPALQHLPYAHQWRALMDQCFGTADFYSSALRELGCEGEEIVIDCEQLQRQWAAEHGVKIGAEWPKVSIRRRKGIPMPALRHENRWVTEALAAQIKAFRPDVLYIQNIFALSPAFLRDCGRPYTRLIVGQHASEPPPLQSCRAYDLLLSTLPSQVSSFRQAGIKSERLALGFGIGVLDKVGGSARRYAAVHVGGYVGAHQERASFMEQIARHLEVDFWGYGSEGLDPQSPIRQRFHGPAWGIDMYRVRAEGRVSLNKHAALAGPYAANMSLFETTGVGTLLMTDQKSNLSELFDVGREVVAYTSVDDCIEKTRYYLEHEEEREAIAKAGQRRTLREHTYYHRMEELLDILKRYL